jgi:tetratricopeptide (TPR) repeat protein
MGGQHPSARIDAVRTQDVATLGEMIERGGDLEGNAPDLHRLFGQLTGGGATIELIDAVFGSPIVAKRLVQIALDRGRHQDALAWTERLLRKTPDDRDTLLLKTLAYMAGGDVAGVLDTCNAIVALNDEDPDSYLQRGIAHLAQAEGNDGGTAGNAARRAALTDFTKVAELAPGVAEGHLYRAEALAELGETEQALDSLETTLALDSSLVEAYEQRGRLLLQQRAYERAHHDFSEVLRRMQGGDPTRLSGAYLNRARASKELKRSDQSISDYGEAIRLEPSSIDAHLERGLLHLEQGRPDLGEQATRAALSDLDVVSETDPECVAAHVGAGDALLARGDPRAVARYTKALKLEPDNGAAYLGRLVAHVNLGLANRSRRHMDEMYKAYAKAVEDGQRAVRLDSDEPWAHGHLGRALRAIAAYDHAVEEFDRACELAERNPLLLTALMRERGETMRLWGVATEEPLRLREALACLREAAEYRRGTRSAARVYETAGLTLLDLGRLEEAVRTFERAVRADGRAPGAQIGKGRALLRIGDVELAGATFEYLLTQLEPYEQSYAKWASVGLLLAQEPSLRQEPYTAVLAPPRWNAIANDYSDRADIFDAFIAYDLAERDRLMALGLAASAAVPAHLADAACALGWSYLGPRQQPMETQLQPEERAQKAVQLGKLALEKAGNGPSSADYLHLLGWALYHTGNSVGAEEHLRAACQRQRANVVFHHHLRLVQETTVGRGMQ